MTERRLLPLGPHHEKWSGAEARRDLRTYASTGGEFDPSRYGRGFLYSPPSGRRDGFKLPIADVYRTAAGSLVLRANRRAVHAAAAAMEGARGGVELPKSARTRVRAELDRYFNKMGERPPWPPYGRGVPKPNPEEPASNPVPEFGGQLDADERAVMARFRYRHTMAYEEAAGGDTGPPGEPQPLRAAHHRLQRAGLLFWHYGPPPRREALSSVTEAGERYLYGELGEGNPRRAKGYPTPTNAFSVFEQLEKHGHVPARVEGTAAPHIKRVIKWGGLEERPEGGWRLTEKGRGMLIEHDYWKPSIWHTFGPELSSESPHYVPKQKELAFSASETERRAPSRWGRIPRPGADVPDPFAPGGARFSETSEPEPWFRPWRLDNRLFVLSSSAKRGGPLPYAWELPARATLADPAPTVKIGAVRIETGGEAGELDLALLVPYKPRKSTLAKRLGEFYEDSHARKVPKGTRWLSVIRSWRDLEATAAQGPLKEPRFGGWLLYAALSAHKTQKAAKATIRDHVKALYYGRNLAGAQFTSEPGGRRAAVRWPLHHPAGGRRLSELSGSEPTASPEDTRRWEAEELAADVVTAEELAEPEVERLPSDLTPPKSDKQPEVSWIYVNSGRLSAKVGMVILMLHKAPKGDKGARMLDAAADLLLEKVHARIGPRRSGATVGVTGPDEMPGTQALIVITGLPALRELNAGWLSDKFAEAWTELFGGDALDAYKETHWGEEADEIFTVDKAELKPAGELVGLGELVEATYETTKGGGEPTQYVHKFGPHSEAGGEAPLLAFDERFRLFVVGGSYTVTSHGIEG